VRALFKDKANVHHPPDNCSDTGYGLAKLDSWLGNGKWDVIWFNFGLHDLKWLDATGKYVTPGTGRQNVRSRNTRRTSGHRPTLEKRPGPR